MMKNVSSSLENTTPKTSTPSDTPSRKYNHRLATFWRSEGEKHLTPPGDDQIAEGEFTRDLLKKIVRNRSVIEVGCGDGRIAVGFDVAQYGGFDINPKIIKKARREHPKYRFHVYTPYDDLPRSDWVFAHTVLLHVDDNDIVPFIKSIVKNTQHVVFSEIMSRRFRKSKHGQKIPPVFNRESYEYVDIMSELGFRKVSEHYYHFNRYHANLTYLCFTAD